MMTTPRTACIDGMAIRWDDQVLEPRPWAAAQAQWAAELHPELAPGPMVELCTGSGYIGLLAARDTGRRAILVDQDPWACSLAASNAEAAGLGHMVSVRQESITGRPLHCVTRPVPLVLADPPYVPSDQVHQFPDDPTHSIDGGPDGLRVVFDVLATAATALLPAGTCLLQVRGPAQAGRIEAALADDDTSPLVVVEARDHGPDRALVRLARR